MIDERHEELASLYAFDLLEGAELAQFEADLAGDPQLQALVRELRETSSSFALAHATPPPAGLRQRILDSLAQAAVPVGRAEIIRPPASVWRFIPWAVAACLAIGLAWLGERFVTVRGEAGALRRSEELAQIAVRSTQQQLEAERIITRRQFADGDQQLAAANAQLAEARTQLGDRDRLLAEARAQLIDRERQLADARNQVADRDRQVASLSQRIDALAGASAEIGRQLGEARVQVAKLTSDLKNQADLADLKITALASLLKNSPQALAVAVWDPKKQEGLLNVQNLPALAANEDYQLWVVDPQYPIPVDGGVFTVEPASGKARLQFKTNHPVNVINAFAVTRERKGGVPKAEGPFVLLGK